MLSWMAGVFALLFAVWMVVEHFVLVIWGFIFIFNGRWRSC
jgi:hypothetical protein